MTLKNQNNAEMQAVYAQLFGKKVAPKVTETKVKEITIKVPEPTIINNYEIKGLKGEKGDRGDKGDTGSQGPRGLQGEQGEEGPRGKIGTKGDKGDRGDIGPQGLTGKQGERGLVGFKGEKGDTGERGPQGIPGPAGQVISTVALSEEDIDNKIKKGFWSLGGTERYRVLNANTANTPNYSIIAKSKLRVLSLKQIIAGTNVTVLDDGTSLTISATGGSGAAYYTWSTIAGTSSALASANGYIPLSSSLTTFTLPAVAAVGDHFKIAGYGSGGWSLAQRASQQVNFGNVATTVGVGGSIASQNQYDGLEVICVVANTNFVVVGSQGRFTVT